MKEVMPVPFGLDGWVYRADPFDRRRVPHRHEELEMNLVLQGVGSYLIGSRRRDLQANDQIWLFPEQNHVLLDKSRDFEMWVAYFRHDLVERACTTHESEVLRTREPGRVLTRSLQAEQVECIANLFKQVESGAEDPPRYNAGIAYSLLLAWHEFVHAPLAVAGHDVHPAVERAAFLIRDQTDLRGIDDLAHRAGLSASRLSRVFHRQMGVSLVSYWNRQRLERFLHLYGDGQRMSVTRAAVEAGFGSYPQFYRVFREHLGCGPAQYRRAGAPLTE